MEGVSRSITDVLDDARARLDYLREQYGADDADYMAFQPLVSFIEAMLASIYLAQQQQPRTARDHRDPLHSRHKGDPL